MTVINANNRLRTPLVALLHPREHTSFVAGMLALGLLAGTFAVWRLGWPLWWATAAVLVLMLVPGVAKWRSDARRYGRTAMVVSILLAAQGFHSVEHITQWIQYHVLHWELRAATGLLSPANAEWVHFVWNWLVLAIVLGLVYAGIRNVWMLLLLAWAGAHTLEHTYLFVRYVQVLDDLRQMGISTITAQGLPGVLGRDGWLARSVTTQNTFFCQLPGLTTAPRLDVHFWWNVGEMLLLLMAAHTFLQRRVHTTPPDGQMASQ